MPRPTVMTEDILSKLRQAFLWGATDREACAWAEISEKTLYNYQEKHPDYIQQKEAWKNNPIMRAKKTVADSLDNVKDAQWYLERKKKDEFSTRQDLTTDGEKITGPVIYKPSKRKNEVLEAIPETRKSS